MAEQAENACRYAPHPAHRLQEGSATSQRARAGSWRSFERPRSDRRRTPRSLGGRAERRWSSGAMFAAGEIFFRPSSAMTAACSCRPPAPFTQVACVLCPLRPTSTISTKTATALCFAAPTPRRVLVGERIANTVGRRAKFQTDPSAPVNNRRNTSQSAFTPDPRQRCHHPPRPPKGTQG